MKDKLYMDLLNSLGKVQEELATIPIKIRALDITIFYATNSSNETISVNKSVEQVILNIPREDVDKMNSREQRYSRFRFFCGQVRYILDDSIELVDICFDECNNYFSRIDQEYIYLGEGDNRGG